MKRILIAGANSYIGMSFKEWITNIADEYLVESISLRDDAWRFLNFSQYDVVLFTAGIAHVKETEENRELYYLVNRDLAYETAKKSKADGVKQFIFLSSMSVYGIQEGVIDQKTPLQPKNHYGKSKLQGEELIRKLEDASFKVAVLRPPMVYGRNCKGNYPKLARLALSLPAFPDISNKRSMIYIDNLCEFIRLIIEKESGGVFFPQNKEYVCTTEMAKLIAAEHGKKLRTTKLFNWTIGLGSIVCEPLRKMFGSLIYSKKLAGSPGYKLNGTSLEYEMVSFEDSIKLTEVN